MDRPIRIAALPQGPELSLLALGLASIVGPGADPGVIDPDPRGEALRPSRAAGAEGSVPGAPQRLSVEPAPGRSAPAESAAARRAEVAPRAEPAGLRLVDRGLLALLQQRGGVLVMRLSPPELGILEIRMRFDAGGVDVLFRPSGDAARDLLQGNLGMLRQSLERHGVGVGRLVVEPPRTDRAEESASIGLGHPFDAAGRESRGRQEAERELRWRTDEGLRLGSTLRPDDALTGTAAEGRSTWPSSSPPPPPRVSSPAATAS